MHDAFTGIWELNPAQSNFDPNHRPAAATMVLERDSEGRYLMTAKGQKENGDPVVERPATFVPDGKEYPLPDLPDLRAVATHPDPNTLRVEVKREDGSIAGGAMYVVSADGNSMSALTFGYDSQLRQFEQRTAWERRSC